MTTRTDTPAVESVGMALPPPYTSAGNRQYTTAEMSVMLTAWLRSLHPDAETVNVRWDAERQAFDTVVRYPQTSAVSISITLD